MAFIDLVKGPDPEKYLPERLPRLYQLAREAYLDNERVGTIPEHLEAEQYAASEESIIINDLMEEQITGMLKDLRPLGELFLMRDAMMVANMYPISGRIQPGAEKAMRNFLQSQGVKTAKHEKVQRDGVRYFQMSEQMKKTRNEQIEKYGQPDKVYGYQTKTKRGFDVL